MDEPKETKDFDETDKTKLDKVLDRQKGEAAMRGIGIGLLAVSVSVGVAALVVALLAGKSASAATVLIEQKLTANSDAKTDYTVKFRNYDAALLEQTSVKNGATVTYDGPNPTRPTDSANTYAFSGWDKDATAVITADTTFTAQYAATPIPVVVPQTYYSVRFINYDGSILDSSSVKKGEKATYKGIATPLRAADSTNTYAFSGWDKEIADTVINSDTIFTAQYAATPIVTPAPITYFTVDFRNYNDTLIDRQSVASGSAAAMPSITPTKQKRSTTSTLSPVGRAGRRPSRQPLK